MTKKSQVWIDLKSTKYNFWFHFMQQSVSKMQVLLVVTTFYTTPKFSHHHPEHLTKYELHNSAGWTFKFNLN